MNNDTLPAIGMADAPLHLPGLDEEGEVYIRRAWAYFYPFLVEDLGLGTDWNDLPDAQTRSARLDRFTAFERSITRSDAALQADRERGLEIYRTTHLLKIAEALGFVQRCRTAAIRNLIRRGLLVPPQKYKDLKSAPAIDAVESWFLSAVANQRTAKQQSALLVKLGACRNEQTASRVVEAMRKAQVQASALARGVILATIDHGWAGMLLHSGHPCADVLLFLQCHANHIADLTPHPEQILGELRADLIALHSTLSAEVGANRRSLWQFNLLHLPPSSPLREAFRQRFGASAQDVIIARLGERRACTPSDASCLQETFLQGGLPALIDWRCNKSSLASDKSLAVQRIQRAVAMQLSPLPLSAQQRAIDILLHLRDACLEVGFLLPIVTLISQHPSNRYRARIGRRVWFGVGASISRRQRKYRRKGKQRWRQEHRESRKLDGPSHEDLLATAFVRRANLKSETEGRNLIRSFITYGGPGLFLRSEWADLFDTRFISFLSFFKLGRPDGALNWQSMMARLQSYAQEEGLTAPTSQVARAIFNRIPKPPNWHGGYGEDVATVRQRSTLVLRAPCLHEVWVALQVPQRLSIALVDEAGHPLSQSAAVLIFFEEHIERPVGLWVDSEPDPGLALHQALWHPGHPNWPLRGAPSVLKIPSLFLKQRQGDIERAADWMSSELQLLNRFQHSRQREKMAKAEDLMSRLVVDGTKFLRKIFGKRPITRREAVDGLLDWLTTGGEEGGRCFPNHRTPELPPGSITYGQTILPGYDLPVAGWLLPVLGQAQTQRNQVVYRGNVYTAPDFQVEPGLAVNLRGMPFLYAGVPNHIFVEETNGRLRCLVVHEPLR
ncbi:hypothetical protein EKD04_019840 [Chloroflexales bacterium ZM16-3]|nr:hypothetical protein [Chloroflexales bacterium ZM16-3]